MYRSPRSHQAKADSDVPRGFLRTKRFPRMVLLGIRIELHLASDLFFESRSRAHVTPLALAELDEVIISQTNQVDLNSLIQRAAAGVAGARSAIVATRDWEGPSAVLVLRVPAASVEQGGRPPM